MTGAGWLAAAPLRGALAGQKPEPSDAVPEITAFEVPEGSPAWGFEVLDTGFEREFPHQKSFVDRTSALALLAAKQALAGAGLLRPRAAESEAAVPAGGAPPFEIGCAYGTTLGCLEAMGIFWNKVKTSNPKFAQPLPFTHGYANSPSSLLCIEFGLRGAAATFSGERLAGMEALLFAFDQIAAGSAECILAGASDSLTPAAHAHLFASGQLSATGQWSGGIIPGEGAAMAVIESAENASRRGARILAEIGAVTQVAEPAELPKPDAGTRVFGLARQTLDVPAAVPQLFTGDLLAASGVLNVALAALELSGSVQVRLAGSGEHAATEALALGGEPRGRLGAVTLRKWVDMR